MSQLVTAKGEGEGQEKQGDENLEKGKGKEGVEEEGKGEGVEEEGKVMGEVVVDSSVSYCLQELLIMTPVTVTSTLLIAVTLMTMSVRVMKMKMMNMLLASRLLRRREPLRLPLQTRPTKEEVCHLIAAHCSV